MSTKDDGGPAFPVFDMAKCQAQGMTMRYWFAGQFLETYVADGIPKAEKIALACYEMADAMLAERAKR